MSKSRKRLLRVIFFLYKLIGFYFFFFCAITRLLPAFLHSWQVPGARQCLDHKASVCLCVQDSSIHPTSLQQKGCLFCGASFNISDKILCVFGLDRFFFSPCNKGSKILQGTVVYYSGNRLPREMVDERSSSLAILESGLDEMLSNLI